MFLTKFTVIFEQTNIAISTKVMNIRVLAAVLAVTAAMPETGAQEPFDYTPEFHGAIRTRWEMETRSGESRFQVRYARFNISGKVAPAIEYYIQTDLCDQGKMKILDAYGRIRIVEGLKVQAGQFRMPFGVEPFRSPQNYLFANRSFMGKLMCNYRKVGVKAMYSVPVPTPLLIEGGVFNTGTISNHNEWNKSYSYAGKATWTVGQFKLSGGALSVLPETTRIYMYDGAVSWENSHVLAAAEYMNEHYADHAHGDSHSYCIYVDYHKPVNAGTFNQWSVQGRFDGQTVQWSGLADDNDNLAHKRITVGSTLTFKQKSVFADIRLNYEKYFYDSGIDAPQGLGDKIVAELAIRF